MGKYGIIGSAFDRIFRNTLNKALDDIDTDINAQKKRVDDLIIANPSPSEVQDARLGFPVLRDKLVDVDEQLAEKTNFVDEAAHYYVGINQKYKTIKSAYDQWVLDGKPVGFIHVYGGTINDYLNAGGHVNNNRLTIIGEEKQSTIWKYTHGGYDYAPFTGGGNFTIKNLTIIADHPEGWTGNGGAYGLHIDHPSAEGKVIVEDCIVHSYQDSAIGCGTSQNQEIHLKNVELYHYAEAAIAGANGVNHGALLYHTSATAGKTGQRFHMENVYAHSINGPGIQLLSSAGGDQDVEVEFINVTARSDYYETFTGTTFEQRVVFQNDNGRMKITEDSKNNNSDKLNYIVPQRAKITEKDGTAISVTDFNLAKSGWFKGDGGVNCKNTPKPRLFIGLAIPNLLTAQITQIAWAINDGNARYTRFSNASGVFSSWVRDDAGYGTTANRETEAYFGYSWFDSTLGKPVWCKTLGAKEVDTLTISAGATASGNITITLNGIAKTVAVVAGDTAITVGNKIRATFFPSWNTGGTNETVSFSSITRGTKTAPTFSDSGTTGVTATFAVTTAGTNNTWVDSAGTAA